MHLLHSLITLYFLSCKKSILFVAQKLLQYYLSLNTGSECFQICLKNITIHQYQFIQLIDSICFLCHFFKLTLTHAVHFCTFFITNKSFPIYDMSLHSFAPFPIYNNPTGSHRVIASLVFHHLSRPGSFPGSIIIRNSIFATKIPLPDYSQIFIARAFASISF